MKSRVFADQRIFRIISCTCLPLLAFVAPLVAQQKGGAQENAKAPLNAALQQELLEMKRQEQAARNKCLEGDQQQQIDCYSKTINPIDEKNTKRLQEIFAANGFPTVSQVGKNGVAAFMLVLQHSKSDELREKCLPAIKDAMQRGEVSSHDYALFLDRLLTHKGKSQIYGTQFSEINGKYVMDATEDLPNLDKRRQAIGLSPIAEYVKKLEEIYKVKVEMPKIQ